MSNNKRVRNLAVSKELWDTSEVIRDEQKHFWSRTTKEVSFPRDLSMQRRRLVYLEWPLPDACAMKYRTRLLWQASLEHRRLVVPCWSPIRCYAACELGRYMNRLGVHCDTSKFQIVRLPMNRGHPYTDRGSDRPIIDKGPLDRLFKRVL